MPYLCALIIFVLFAGIAMTVGEGLWNNAVNLLAIIFSGVAAICIGYPLGIFALEKFEKEPEFSWFFVLAGVWLAFFASIMIFRIVAERLSRTRVKFVPPLEMIAGPLVGIVAAFMFASFLTFTLYYIPIRAGYWDASKAAGWQQTTLGLRAPFYTVLKSVAGETVAKGAVGQ